MQISQRGVDFIKGFEKFVPEPYNDGYGGLTIGWGHLIQPGESFGRISPAEGEQILRRDVTVAENAVDRGVKVPITQAMYDALVSLAFNWGSGNFASSTHLMKLNSGDYMGTAQRISEHPVTSGGQQSRGLVRRRAAEKDLFLSGGLPGGADESPDDSGVLSGMTAAALPFLILGGGLLLFFCLTMTKCCL